MKRIFKYVGLFTLICFSFYYTKEVAEFMKNDDAVMKEIENYALTHNKECIEGYMTEDGVVLGISGLIVDYDSSYSNMKGTGFNSSLIKYKESPCVLSLNNNKKNYIIGGNPSKNSVSLIINVINGKSISDFVSISKTKGIKLSFMIDYNYLKNNKDLIKLLIDEGYDFIYKGKNEEELKEYLKESFKNQKNICIYTGQDDILNYCANNDLNTIKTNKMYDRNYLSSVKKDLSKGSLIVLDESVILKNELGVIINYIKSRGLKIVTINEHLS